MFYSQFILAKKGPLGTIWIAAHLERKLRKTQVADTNIPLSVDSILFPDVPIALRLSSHLLLGVVRIYSRKVNYLFDDCSEALLKIKQAFRSTAVDLPPEESTAPYHSITLPETFDLDDFELPDNDILQGNYVDHHVSTKEQITLQDTMDGVVYTTSQFGLDERFGDGDSSHVGLDLEQDMLLDKFTAPCPEEIPEVDPHVADASPARLVESFAPLPLYGTNKIEGQHVNLEVTDYAQGPSTPRLVNEPNLSSVQEGLACDDHLDPEDPHCTESLGVESTENTSMKLDLHGADDATDLLLASHADCDTVEQTALDTEENDHDSWDLRDKEDMKGNLPAEVAVEGLLEKGDVGDVGDANEVSHCKGSSVALNGEHGEFVGVRCHEVDNMDIGIETEGSESREKVDVPNSIPSLEVPDAVVPVNLQEVVHEPENPKTNNHLDDEHSGLSFGSFLRPCSSFLGVQSYHDIDDTMLPHDIPLEDMPCTLGKDEAPHPSETCSNIQGEVCLVTSSVRGEECQMVEPTTSTDAVAGGQCHNVESVENQFEKLDGSTTFELPAPERLLSVSQMPLDKPEGLLLEALSDKEVIERSDGASTGAKISGNKRTYMDSMVDVQCLNSADTFGMNKSKRTINSIPDDDDLLSSILAGRRSSVLKIKPSPVASEVASTKRVKSTLRPTAMKRKVLVDDSMVLLGDTIRQQLINTEDIRRLRKKAPCTRTEILIIERQFLEEDIFHEAVLTGMSTELTRLHGEKFDVSGIEITVNDGNIVPSDVEMNKETLHGPSFGENSVLQGNIEPVTSGVIIGGQEFELYIQAMTKQDEHMLHTEDDDMPGLSVTRTSEHETLCERNDGKIDKVFHSPVPETLHNDPISRNVTDTPFGSVAKETFKHATFADASLPMDTLGMPCVEVGNELLKGISFPGSGISGEGLDAIEVIDCKIDNVAADATTDLETLLAESKVNKSSEITSDVQANVDSHADDRDTLLVDMSAETARLANDTFVNIAEDIGSDKLGYINEEGGMAATLGYDGKDEKSVCLSGEDNKIDSTNGAGQDRDMDKESLNDKEYLNDNLDGQELHQQSSLNAENPLNNNVEGQCGDFQDVTFANDTEFLNVDDDEMAEDEDFAVGAEDTRLLDNSGWSSRTRAVAKFLQNLFDKEAAYGVKVLSMDNLLTGKTRKEASRMFFETLVLKTKDYIQVEQVKPFNDISIKARTELVKSDF